MHRLIVEVGWPVLILCAAIFVTAVPVLVIYARYEIRLARRAQVWDPSRPPVPRDRSPW